MRICSIDECSKKHEAKGFCKVHYRSFSKYGDALHVQNQRAQSEQLRTKREKEKVERLLQAAEAKKLAALAGHCTVLGCNDPIKSKLLCEKHYARMLRKGSLDLEKKRNEINVDTCLAIGCDNPHLRHGFCSTHLIYIRENETPYKPKIIKLCGVKGCDKEHMGIGLCNFHYNQWKIIKRDYKLHSFNKLK